ncbi:hypothetical protein JTB14_031340 [Gonioctena quinquepunctata]|nr:hypothetical protein JTB14_031340 [Gonioctena quinquepunctata]
MKSAEPETGDKTVEKENKSELANGVEKEVTNGESAEEKVEKQNGEASKESASKVDDIKVKKIDEASEGAPPVSVV